MSDRYVIQAIGDVDLVRQLDQAIVGLTNPAELMRDVGAILESNVNLRVKSTKRDPNDVPWPKISDLTPVLYWTIDKQRRHDLKKDANGETVIPPMPGTLLNRTNHMLQTLASNPGRDWVEVGFSSPYAIYHETGTKRGGRDYMPRRGLLMGDPEAGTLGAEDRQEVLNEINSYLGHLLTGNA